MREKLAVSVVLSLFVALAGCGGGDSGPGGGGGGTGGIDSGPCAGIERVCRTTEGCPTLQKCSSCGACVADDGLGSCEDTADCPVGRACRVPDGGTELACLHVVCNANAECGEGEACDLERHACVPGDCLSLGCPQGTYCNQDQVACVECVNDGHCAGTDQPYCIEERGVCVVCEIDSDCGPGRRCVDDQCVSCASNDDCTAPNRLCRDDGLCVACISNADCPGVPCLPEGRCDLGPVAGEACDPSRICAPGYRCVGDAPGTCFLSCNPYAPACGTGEACAMIPDDNGHAVMEGDRPAGICARDGAGRAVGEACDDAHACRIALVCLRDSPDTSKCRAPCDPDVAGTCGTGQECAPVAIGANDADVGFCTPPTTWGDPCVRDRDCDAGQGCVLVVDGDQLAYSCQFTEGTETVLSPCTADTECRSGYCMNAAEGQPGFCYGACATAADCGTGLCEHLSFNLSDSETATALGCIPGCDQDADCSQYGTFVCGVAVDRVDVELYGECSTRLGAADGGEACDADEDCGGGWCLGSDTTGFCVAPCDSDADCAGGTRCRATAFQLTETPPAFDTLEVCWGASCTRDGDCPANFACTFESDAANPMGAIRWSCMPGDGSLPAGSDCTGDAECLSGLCLNGYCFGTCASDTDCAGDTMCYPDYYTYDLPDGTSVGITACVGWY